MKIGICGDIHWSTYSSILRSRSKHFSKRLEGLIYSLSWIEETFKKYKCTEEIFLGDTFDKADLSAEELTALTEVEWNRDIILRHFIVGNHESGVSSLIYNSTQALNEVGVIEDQPYLYPLDDKTEFLFLPYITEDDRKPLKEYLEKRNKDKRLIIFSHNDIKDFQMGVFLSKTGFSISEIEENCDLYINGHLHNGSWVTNKILNLGVLTGQNFSEDAFKYEHHIAILDTDTLKIEFIENPYAFNFYKFEINNEKDIDKLNSLKANSIISLKCNQEYLNKVKDLIDKNSNIIEHKIIVYRNELNESEEVQLELNNIDHLKQFQEFILSKKDDIGDENIIKAELMEVCK